MKANEWTAALLVAVIFCSGIYDVIAAIWVGYDATITAVVQNWTRAFPALSLLVGFVLGHLFWPVRTTTDAILSHLHR